MVILMEFIKHIEVTCSADLLIYYFFAVLRGLYLAPKNCKYLKDYVAL